MERESEDANDSAIVISGISGRFPQSDNMNEFADNLYNKVDLFGDSENRIKHKFPGHPKRYGIVRKIEKCDPCTTGMPPLYIKSVDPQGRVLSEHAYEALLDAGICPKTLSGSKTGVFVGCFNFDSFEHWMHSNTSKPEIAFAANAAFSLANNLSFSLGLNGPSMAVDTACSSSLYALNLGFNAIRLGECDIALIAGSNLILNPFPTEAMNRGGVLANDGISRPFDKNATGYVRAEAVCVVVLQRSKHAKRIYAKVVDCKTNNDGFKSDGMTVPSAAGQKKLFEDVYKDSAVDASRVDYIEAHATSTQIGDKIEVESIDAVFCKNRTEPLKIGSVKSNIGHAEGAAGITSLAKALLIFENDKLIPNLNLENLRDDCPALSEGRLVVVQDVEPFEGKYIGVNSFGILGANAHVLLEKNSKKKINCGLPEDDLPRLVFWAGRTDEAVNKIYDDIVQKPLDAEFIGLLQSSQVDSNSNYTFRGFGIFAKGENGETTDCVARDVTSLNEAKRPIAFVYSGVGSQWLGMGKDLMKIPIIADAIEICHSALEGKNINLKEIITSTDPTMFDNPLNTFVGVAAIQIGLTDLLKSLGVSPDHIIGHSVGELGCAYADETLSVEETILSAYSRGMALNEVKREKGAMAAIGMGYEDLKKIIPSGIEIACRNSKESCTVSGCLSDVESFVLEIKQKKFLAKKLASSDMAFHSSHIADSGPILLQKLRQIIKNPMPRSSKWISTSVPKDQWESTDGSFSSAEYHANNLLNQVLFEDAVSMLPEDTMMIEVAPHSLLMPILKTSVPKGAFISLTQKDVDDSSIFLMKSLGKLYQHGVDLDISKMYPPVEFPVSRGTKMISPLIKWEHSENWTVPTYDPYERCERRNISINLSDIKYEFMKGHIVDDQVILPATGFLAMVWETFAMMLCKEQSELAVTFEEVRFLRAVFLKRSQESTLTVIIRRGSGRFDITEGGTTVADGVIKVSDNQKFVTTKVDKSRSLITCTKEEFYLGSALKGMKYLENFQLLESLNGNENGYFGKIRWDSNWVTFMDNMMQFSFLNGDTSESFVVVSIREMTIDPKRHQEMLDQCADDKLLDVVIDKIHKVAQCGGIEVKGADGSFVIRRRPLNKPILEISPFVSHFPTPLMSGRNMAKFFFVCGSDSTPMNKVKIVEVDGDDGRDSICEYFAEAFDDIPLIIPAITYLTKKELELENVPVADEDLASVGDVSMVIVSNSLFNHEYLKSIYDMFEANGAILCRENEYHEELNLPENFKYAACITLENEFVYLIQCVKVPVKPFEKVIKFPSGFDDFTWIPTLSAAVAAGPTLVYSRSGSDVSGLLGLANCVRKEPGGTNLRCVLIEDDSAPEFDPNLPFYKTQLDLGWTRNVYKNKAWGSYTFLSLPNQSVIKPRQDYCFIHQQIRGDLESLNWVTGPHSAVGSRFVEVHYSALNFRDVMTATGRISMEYEFSNRIDRQYCLGFEFAGIASDGRRVMAVVESRAFATYIPEENLTMIEVPDDWTLEQAATVPLVYTTVYLAFFHTVVIEEGKSILIHAGSGGVGLAAIRVALGYGLEVFTTVSTEEKKQFLLDEFPQLQARNIGNSRDTTFEEMIMNETNGKGVDYVLNSLSEDKLQASLRCLANDGFFLEVGKFDMLVKNKISLSHFLRGITFKAILLKDNTFEIHKNLMKRLIDDINRGIIKPLNTTVFDACDIVKAARYLARAKHVGKVLLKIRESELSRASLPIDVKPRIFFNPNHSYIVPGGLGGMGLGIVDWMVLRECKKVVLSSRRSFSDKDLPAKIKFWKTYGVEVSINNADITTKAGCELLITDAMKMGPVGGIFILSAVLEEGMLVNLDEAKFLTVLKPKAHATAYLDEVSRKLCPELKHFVVFSSVACGRGNYGQTNYGMSNSLAERIMERRHADGLPAKAIQWGPVASVGLFAKTMEATNITELSGVKPQTLDSCCEVLDNLLSCESCAIVSCFVASEKSTDSIGSKDVIEILLLALGYSDKRTVALDAPLTEIGMNSLVAAEIQHVLEREFGIHTTFQEIKTKSLNDIRRMCENAKNPVEVQEKVVSTDMLYENISDASVSDKTIEKLKEQDAEGSPKLLVVPGIFGGAGDIWASSPNSVYVLHHIKMFSMTKFDDIYDAVVDEVVELFRDDATFVLVGYSFGALLALKLAEKLESCGKLGKLVLIDGSPQFLKKRFAESFPSNMTDAEIQNFIVKDFARKAFKAVSNEELDSACAQPTWESKIQKLAELDTDNNHKAVMSASLEAAFNRIKIILNEDFTNIQVTDKTPVMLIQPSEFNPSIGNDYGLKEHFSRDVRVETVKGNQYNMLGNKSVVEVINSL